LDAVAVPAAAPAAVPGVWPIGDCRWAAAARSLSDNGYAVLDCIPDPATLEAVLAAFQESMTGFPEYVRRDDDPTKTVDGHPMVYVAGGFGALGMCVLCCLDLLCISEITLCLGDFVFYCLGAYIFFSQGTLVPSTASLHGGNEKPLRLQSCLSSRSTSTLISPGSGRLHGQCLTTPTLARCESMHRCESMQCNKCIILTSLHDF
jgi:hypothetical protein